MPGVNEHRKATRRHKRAVQALIQRFGKRQPGGVHNVAKAAGAVVRAANGASPMRTCSAADWQNAGINPVRPCSGRTAARSGSGYP